MGISSSTCGWEINTTAASASVFHYKRWRLSESEKTTRQNNPESESFSMWLTRGRRMKRKAQSGNAKRTNRNWGKVKQGCDSQQAKTDNSNGVADKIEAGWRDGKSWRCWRKRKSLLSNMDPCSSRWVETERTLHQHLQCCRYRWVIIARIHSCRMKNKINTRTSSPPLSVIGLVVLTDSIMCIIQCGREPTRSLLIHFLSESNLLVLVHLFNYSSRSLVGDALGCWASFPAPVSHLPLAEKRK